MSDKAKEIQLLHELIELDGYFAELFGEDLEQMVENIENDHPIEFDTNFNERVAAVESEKTKLQQKLMAKVYCLCRTLLNVRESGNDTKKIKERVAHEIGLPEVIALKHDMGLEWDKEEKEYLLNLVNLERL